MSLYPQPHIRNRRNTAFQIAYLACAGELRQYHAYVSGDVEAVGESLCRNCGTLIMPGDRIVLAESALRQAWRHLQCPSEMEVIWALNRVELDLVVDTTNDCMRQTCHRCRRMVENVQAHRVLSKDDDGPGARDRIIFVCGGCLRS